MIKIPRLSWIGSFNERLKTKLLVVKLSLVLAAFGRTKFWMKEFLGVHSWAMASFLSRR